MPPPAINAPPITPSQSLCCFARVNHAHIERHGKAVELPGGDDPPSAEYESAVLPLNYGSIYPPRLAFSPTLVCRGLTCRTRIQLLALPPPLAGFVPGAGIEPASRAFNSNIPSRCKALPSELPRHNARLSGLSIGLFRLSCGQETHPPALTFLAWILSVPRSPMRTRLFPLSPACPSHPGGPLVRGGRKNGFNHGLPTVRGEVLSPALIPCGTSGEEGGTRTHTSFRTTSDFQDRCLTS